MEGSLGCSGKIARYQYKRRHIVRATLGVRKRGDVWKNRTERINQKLLKMGRGRKKRGNAFEATGIKLDTLYIYYIYTLYISTLNFYNHETKPLKFKTNINDWTRETRIILTPVRKQYCIFLLDYILRAKRTAKNTEGHSVVLSLAIILYYYFETMFIYIIG